ncbi:MAG: phytanoyl-CoA dioxygenase family protein [Spirochaetaceae bacterium]|nr:phytanoyl-CoA dioxygenase family protein [Spirochaetaceae bacterium]
MLNVEELRFFKRNGYLVKRGIMDAALMARARESLWEAPPRSLKRDDPTTWVGPLPAGDLSKDPDSVRGEYHWKYRRVGAEPWIVRMLATDPAIFAIAEQMLGAGELQPPERIRGIYCTLPFGDRPRPPVGCHCDGHPFHLGVVGYLDDVAPGGGGFHVWPGSHRAFYHTFRTGYVHEPTEAHDAALERVNRDTPPVECHGKAGDVVFWHHRLGHMAGHNYSSHIRQAVLYDYCKRDLQQVQDQPPPADMWQHWSSQLRAIR